MSTKQNGVRMNSSFGMRLNQAVAGGLGLAVALAAVSLPTRGWSESLLLSGATVHTVSGETLNPGQVLIENGKISAVGITVAAPNATRLDLAGQHLYPGLIALDTGLGLVEIGAVRASVDSSEVGDFTPDVESWIAVNPDSELIPVTRANGIAYFEPVPQGGMVSGQSGLVAVEGWTTEQRTLKKPMALHVFWPSMALDLTPREGGRGGGRGRRGGGGPGGPKSPNEQATERAAKVRSLDDFFAEARAYAKAREAGGHDGVAAPEVVPAWEAMLPYVKGDLPVMIHADDFRQIKSAVGWAVTNKVKMILAGGRDAWMVPGLLATNKIPVIFTATYELPGRDTEPYDVHFKAAGLLHQAGVQVIFSLGTGSMEAPHTRNLPYEASQSMAFGLPADEALKGITLYPAQAAGVGERLGSIEPGKEATLFAADGDILDIRSNVKRMWLAGKEISLESRHTRLYEKYKNRPKVETH